ncbi:TonB family protein [Erythrobacter sp. THAF29]|uniref:TonB family protein n=1 Tax=Erythrobacter sp. THAF29 TaxID=2587851 RepID=UPI001269535C|nr:TonB family protein [Erythrobacter sp. THAF29]QFT76764.1 Gram-negative bacterial tonB protein [Erythrobacter sp. THAF29]
MQTPAKTRYSSTMKRPRWWLVLAIVLLHILALYGLARALAPEFTASVEGSVVEAFTVTITAPPDPPPPENQPESDEGAQGDPGKEAVPEPVTAPTSRIETQPTPRPQASSTGTATRSGARDTGEGTGAAGTGTGTGSGNRGGGRGGVAVSKPVHISGSINNARDYPTPPGGREARRGTEVIVKVTVGVDGRARGCSIYRPSPDPEADRITCRLVEERLRFRPATDANGNSVPAPFYWRQRWF